MDLVIDANILMSALISTEGKTFDLIFNDRLKLFAPEFLLEEVKKHKAEVIKKSGLEDSQLNIVLEMVSSRIDFVPQREFKEFIAEARKSSPDPDDTEYLALASNLKCGVWSNDKKLKEQHEIKICHTHELLQII